MTLVCSFHSIIGSLKLNYYIPDKTPLFYMNHLYIYIASNKVASHFLISSIIFSKKKKKISCLSVLCCTFVDINSKTRRTWLFRYILLIKTSFSFYENQVIFFFAVVSFKFKFLFNLFFFIYLIQVSSFFIIKLLGFNICNSLGSLMLRNHLCFLTRGTLKCCLELNKQKKWNVVDVMQRWYYIRFTFILFNQSFHNVSSLI